MHCLTEETIEIAVLHEMLNQYSNEKVLTHIASCSHCRELYESVRNYYTTVQQIDTAPFSRQELDFYNKITPTAERKIKKATPLVFEDTNRLGERNRCVANSSVTVLAAETASPVDRRRYENVAVLVTREQDILIRILQNQRSGEFTAHLVSTDEHKYSFVLALLKGLTQPCASNRWGEIQLNDLPAAFLDNPQLSILLPRAVFKFPPSRISNQPAGSTDDKDILLDTKSRTRLKVQSSANGYNVSCMIPSGDKIQTQYTGYCMAINSQDETEVVPFRNGIARFRLISYSDSVQIRLFDTNEDVMSPQ